MSKEKTPITAAVRMLRETKVEFTDHLYAYEERGGTAVSSASLGVPEHAVVKTLAMEVEDDAKRPLIVLMHGDLDVSTKELARVLGVKRVAPCTPERAQQHTGYLVGGTSPFGLRKPLPIYVEETILTLERLYINGGKRGYLVSMRPADLVRVLQPKPVRVGIPG